MPLRGMGGVVAQGVGEGTGRGFDGRGDDRLGGPWSRSEKTKEVLWSGGMLRGGGLGRGDEPLGACQERVVGRVVHVDWVRCSRERMGAGVMKVKDETKNGGDNLDVSMCIFRDMLSRDRLVTREMSDRPLESLREHLQIGRDCLIYHDSCVVLSFPPGPCPILRLLLN